MHGTTVHLPKYGSDFLSSFPPPTRYGGHKVIGMASYSDIYAQLRANAEHISVLLLLPEDGGDD